MEQNIKSLCDSLLQSVREYCIKDVSMGQYETVCRKIINFASEKGVSKYYHGLEGETRVEMSTVLRHFFKFVEEKTDQEKLCITDELLMEFFTKELQNTNKGSMGRALRANHTCPITGNRLLSAQWVLMKSHSGMAYMQEVVKVKINDYLEEYFLKMHDFRAAAGYATVTYKATLKPFIGFCISNYPDEEAITAEMVDEWLNYNKRNKAA